MRIVYGIETDKYHDIIGRSHNVNADVHLFFTKCYFSCSVKDKFTYWLQKVYDTKLINLIVSWDYLMRYGVKKVEKNVDSCDII